LPEASAYRCGVGANGLIVAFVVAVWAAYFVPLVLRRYDEASSSESLEPLSPLSRVVSRRRGAEGVVDDVQDTAEDDAVEVTVEPEAVPAPRVSRTTTSAPQRRAAVVAARRRRRTLVTLLSALTVVGALAAFSVVAPVWVAVPAVLVVAWLVACRVQVRAERGISRPKVERTSLSDRVPSSLKKAARSATERPARRSAAPSADEEHTVVVSHQFEDVDPGRKHVMERAELPEDALEEKLQIAVPSISTQGAPLWDPLPVTLPTYVTKPRVGRTVRTIDFDAPGAWTSGHVEGEDVELPGRPRSEQSDAQPSRRASGE
jgi:hypothetical protein